MVLHGVSVRGVELIDATSAEFERVVRQLPSDSWDRPTPSEISVRELIEHVVVGTTSPLCCCRRRSRSGPKHVHKRSARGALLRYLNAGCHCTNDGVGSHLQCRRELLERGADAIVWVVINSEFVAATTQVAPERMSGRNHLQ
jgi:hypothetical protein